MSAATTKQIETLNSLVNEINAIKAKNSANYSIKRALYGVETMVEKARKSGDKALYSSAIGMLIRRKKFVQNYVR